MVKWQARLLRGMSAGHPEMSFVTCPIRSCGGVKMDQKAALFHKLRTGL